MDFERCLIQAAEEANITITEKQAEKFRIYKEMLVETNKVMNLTALTDDKDIALKHFIDSISPLVYLDISGKNVVDVGTGAGFPSLPMKIAVEDMKLTLIDSLEKRIGFLKDVCGAINAENIDFVHSRAEEAGQDKNFREKFDVCVARAVAPMKILCEYCLPFVKKGGIFVALKGPLLESELAESENAINILGGKLKDIKGFHIPDTDIVHYIGFIEKTKDTPSRYPRKFAKIKKKPL